MFLDWAYPRWRTAIELNGYEPHANRKAFEHLHERPHLLKEIGWTHLAYTFREVVHEELLVLRSLHASLPDLFISRDGSRPPI